jgi:hypothetical protein
MPVSKRIEDTELRELFDYYAGTHVGRAARRHRP